MTAVTLAKLVAVLTLGLFAAPLAAEVQQVRNVPRIGILSYGTPADTSRSREAFLAGLRSLGHVEGQTLVAVLFNPAFRVRATSALQPIEEAARTLGLTLQPLAVRGPDDFAGAFTSMVREGAGALYALSDPLLFAHRTRLVELAARHRIPTMYGTREFVEAGGLMDYATDLPDLYRRSAVHVDKILKGARPGDLPVEQPTRFEVVVNLKTAKALGLTIPPAVLLRTDHLIE